ncbi:unnamed protein product (mitochondrion) [Plasmodiophora brassicae]|uniref:Elongation of fatty acids protein n=1 Tax=Plasmodiophora brassicae TaxID=37360 RepID=A0A0G4IIQ2_PLABS|nr:hypothetical protein PBRA_003813 [Plasmodiophora brassicae]SPQ94329.1 unnamed protein product [Plasmodiophora brassicae]
MAVQHVVQGLWKEAVDAADGSAWRPSPMTQDWALMDTTTAAATVGAYLVGILVLRVFMGFRGKGYNVKSLVLIHNMGMFLLSAYMCVETIRQAWLANYSLFGNAVDESPKGIGMARILHIFFVSKVFEFMDTIIMCLRCRFRQITFLHVYHHASIFAIWWAIVKYYPGGEAYFSCTLNSFVHVAMYGYYFWSAVVPRTDEKRPHWTHPAFYRRYITRLQMTQFTVMLFQAAYDCVVPSPYPKRMAMLLFVYMLTMLSLFANFYSKSYSKSGKKAEHMKEA